MTRQKILFLNLSAFSLTGGIEKFNKSFLKALFDIKDEVGFDVESYSLHDKGIEEKYFPKHLYTAFSGKRISFVTQSILKARSFDTIILGHINLAVIGHVIKNIFPQKKIVLITHGIEVWTPLSGFKKLILKKADLILSVSSFTKNKLVEINKIDPHKIKIFYNTIDPFFKLPVNFTVNQSLRKRYSINENDFVLYTLTRLSSAEKYKGYDIVIKCLPQLKEVIPNLKYVIAGKYDDGEKRRVDEIIKQNNLETTVVFTGFIKDEEVQDHYQMSDLFIMPSKGEGFGIVFIEAMVCGLPVIAGNKDGSVDAVQNGALGMLVDPENEEEIKSAVLKFYNRKDDLGDAYKFELQQDAINIFGFDNYKKKLKELLN